MKLNSLIAYSFIAFAAFSVIPSSSHASPSDWLKALLAKCWKSKAEVNPAWQTYTIYRQGQLSDRVLYQDGESEWVSSYKEWSLRTVGDEGETVKVAVIVRQIFDGGRTESIVAGWLSLPKDRSAQLKMTWDPTQFEKMKEMGLETLPGSFAYREAEVILPALKNQKLRDQLIADARSPETLEVEHQSRRENQVIVPIHMGSINSGSSEPATGVRTQYVAFLSLIHQRNLDGSLLIQLHRKESTEYGVEGPRREFIVKSRGPDFDGVIRSFKLNPKEPLSPKALWQLLWTKDSLQRVQYRRYEITLEIWNYLKAKFPNLVLGDSMFPPQNDLAKKGLLMNTGQHLDDVLKAQEQWGSN